MKRTEILGKAVFDFKTFFYDNEVDEYKKTLTEFIRQNEDMPDEEFYEKFQKQFATIKVLDQSFSRLYLSRIASDVKTIRIIAVIYLIASIIGGLYLASEVL